MWLLDSSENLSSSGATVSCLAKASGSSKFNAMWNDPVTSGRHTWAVTYVSGAPGLWIGVTTPAKFDSGWKCKSMSFGGNTSDGGGLITADFGPRPAPAPAKFDAGWKCKSLSFGGNTSDGGALITADFGPRPAPGDVLHITLDLSPERLELAFAINGRGLGTAFRIDAPFPQPWCPVVSFSDGPAEAALVKLSEPLGESATAAAGVVAPPAGSPEGTWRLAKDGRATLEVVVDGKELRMGGKVANRMMGAAKRGAEGKWASVGPVAMTRMMPPLDMRGLENEVSKGLGCFCGAGGDDEDDAAAGLRGLENEVSKGLGCFVELKVVGDTMEMVVLGGAALKWERFTRPAAQPAGKDKVRWLND
eukprot:CAMPEP_0174914156 /NCGR_PEP_ID=MMETSP0167-20121228/80695_1 /TAXON_ID=38298 /ORGANISM="Rhodella maculata, Strain CCMP736" /LENGTH=362 /DNA_ID=CAMNT_0016158907 /DNA_START=645 /DNA_END=1734 /DNA_ORIENTATION=+